jgi:hypothetical protein
LNIVNEQELATQQVAWCRKYGQPCIVPAADTKLGFAFGTRGSIPVNGFAHPPEGDTNGWYIWCGEELSSAADFFSPMHTAHVKDKCPEALQFLRLPPGYRFLLAGEHVDVWNDPTLFEGLTHRDATP